MKWMFMPFMRATDFSGRSCRREYWMFMALKIICSIAIGIALSITGAIANAPIFSGNFLGALIGNTALLIAAIAYLLVFLLPEIALTVRRWHDIGNSGWTIAVLIVFGAIPYIGFLAGFVHIFAMCTPGDKGANQYGSPPEAKP